MNDLIRVCYVVSGDLWGGAEAQVHQLVKCVIDRDAYKVFVITLNKGILFEKLSELPISVTTIEENKLSMLEMIVGIRKYLKNNNIDLVHCHGFKENFLAGIAARFFLRCHVVRTHHGRGVVDGSVAKSLVEKINAYIFTDKIIAVSRELSVFLKLLGYPARKIEVIHNGIDCKELSVSKNTSNIIEQHSIPTGTFIIGTAGRIEQEKGYQYLLLALKELIERKLPVVLVIVGSGNLKQKYQQMACEMNIDNSVVFAGFQNDVSCYLNIFDIFVMMSLNEGIPLALIEAMCMGKPVVCSAVGGIPEVVTSGVNGFLVPSEDYKSCANACNKIISNKALKEGIGANARKHVIANFSSKKTADDTINLYEKIRVA